MQKKNLILRFHDSICSFPVPRMKVVDGKKKKDRKDYDISVSKFKLKCNNINDLVRERTVVASKFVAPSRSAYEVIDISKKP